MSACNSERMVKIGAELSKLSPNKTGYPFLDHPVYFHIFWKVSKCRAVSLHKLISRLVFMTYTSHRVYPVADLGFFLERG